MHIVEFDQIKEACVAVMTTISGVWLVEHVEKDHVTLSCCHPDLFVFVFLREFIHS